MEMQRAAAELIDIENQIFDLIDRYDSFQGAIMLKNFCEILDYLNKERNRIIDEVMK